MRAYVNLCGWTMSDHGLRRALREPADRGGAGRVSEGNAVECVTEEDIFAACGLPYRKPTEREAEVREIALDDGGAAAADAGSGGGGGGGGAAADADAPRYAPKRPAWEQ